MTWLKLITSSGIHITIPWAQTHCIVYISRLQLTFLHDLCQNMSRALVLRRGGASLSHNWFVFQTFLLKYTILQDHGLPKDLVLLCELLEHVVGQFENVICLMIEVGFGYNLALFSVPEVHRRWNTDKNKTKQKLCTEFLVSILSLCQSNFKLGQFLN